jgi:hypothetical protein
MWHQWTQMKSIRASVDITISNLAVKYYIACTHSFIGIGVSRIFSNIGQRATTVLFQAQCLLYGSPDLILTIYWLCRKTVSIFSDDSYDKQRLFLYAPLTKRRTVYRCQLFAMHSRGKVLCGSCLSLHQMQGNYSRINSTKSLPSDADRCFSPIRVVEVPVFVCLRSSCNHMTEAEWP